MLLHVNPTTRTARRITGTPLKQFGLDERGLQDVLFRSLDRLIGEDELLLLMQSRHWQEEPDLMALDREGKLYIFEIKIWESRRENVLQGLRYGQINGGLDYDGLNQIWQRFAGADLTLEEHIKTSLTSSSRARSSMKAGVCDSYLMASMSRRGSRSSTGTPLVSRCVLGFISRIPLVTICCWRYRRSVPQMILLRVEKARTTST